MTLIEEHEPTVDARAAEEFGNRVVGIVNDAAVAMLLSIGHQTGLFDALADLPAATSTQLADAAGLNERYVRELLGGLVSAGIIDYHPDTVTYELPPEHSANEAFTAAREALQKEGAQLLFWCQARDCGENSLWANEVFGNPLLSGADDQQAYLLLRLAAPQDDSLMALYSITRGNRRAYLHVEQFAANAPLGELLPTSATLLRELRDTGKLDLPKLVGEPQATWVSLISRGLNLDTTSRISLSGSSAEAWRQALVAAGVRSARLELGDGKAAGLHLELLR